MSSQMLRYEEYSLNARAPRVDKRGRRIKGRKALGTVTGEIARNLACAPHVPCPREPIVLQGMPPNEFLDWLIEKVSLARNPRGHKLRKDALVTVAGFCSYPRFVRELEEDDDLMQEFYKWLDRDVNFCNAWWQKNLKSIVLHMDEPRPNVHFLCTPDFDSGETTLALVHPGRREVARVLKEHPEFSNSRRLRDEARTRGMQKFLDDYFESVSIEHGHMRRGRGNRRLERPEWQAEQQQARALKRARERAEEVDKESKANADKIIESAITKGDEILAEAASKARDLEAASEGRAHMILEAAAAKFDEAEKMEQLAASKLANVERIVRNLVLPMQREIRRLKKLGKSVPKRAERLIKDALELLDPGDPAAGR